MRTTSPPRPPAPASAQAARMEGQSRLATSSRRLPFWVRAALREPLVHFLFLGLGLWAAQRRFTPTPRIELSAAAVAQIERDFTRRSGRAPTAEVSTAVLRESIDSEILYREALKRGLLSGDVIVRRRLIQKMEFLAEALPELTPQAPPTDAELQAVLENNAERYRIPARQTLRHVFTAQHGEESGSLLTSRAQALRQRLEQAAPTEQLGEPFPRGNELPPLSAGELDGILGPGFASAVLQLPLGQWSLPLASSYGLHLVQVRARQPEQSPPLAPVEVLLIVRTLDAQVFSRLLRSDGSALALPRSQEPLSLSPAQVVHRYVKLGALHIAGGPDHLLFVAGLLLLATGLRRMLLTLSAFTLGHSMTLALAVLGIVKPAVPLIEVLIALSVLLLARELGCPPGAAPPSLSRRSPATLALLFGLLHGLGFAGALTQAGLPPAQLPLSLLCFNLGVELGQLVFVLAIQVPLRALLWALRTKPRLMQLPGYALGTLAMLWTLQRLDRSTLPQSPITPSSWPRCRRASRRARPATTRRPASTTARPDPTQSSSSASSWRWPMASAPPTSAASTAPPARICSARSGAACSGPPPPPTIARPAAASRALSPTSTPLPRASRRYTAT